MASRSQSLAIDTYELASECKHARTDVELSLEVHGKCERKKNEHRKLVAQG